MTAFFSPACNNPWIAYSFSFSTEATLVWATRTPWNVDIRVSPPDRGCKTAEFNVKLSGFTYTPLPSTMLHGLHSTSLTGSEGSVGTGYKSYIAESSNINLLPGKLGRSVYTKCVAWKLHIERSLMCRGFRHLSFGLLNLSERDLMSY